MKCITYKTPQELFGDPTKGLLAKDEDISVIIDYNKIKSKDMKETLFINLSNHPSQKWSSKQIERALEIVDNCPIIDMQFPNIDPEMSTNEVQDLAGNYIDKILDLLNDYECDNCIVHIMGEMTFVYNFVDIVKNYYGKITCVASTTRRIVSEDENGVKKSTFEFVNFRRY